MKISKFALVSVIIVILVGIGIIYITRDKMENKTSSNEETIKLPEPRHESQTSIEKAILERRSIRDYQDKPLKLEEVSQLLWAAQGITDKEGHRAAPSAGGLYPLELYLVAGNISDLTKGIYHYQPQEHQLKKVVEGDRRQELCQAAVGQSSVKEAAAVIVFAAVYERTTQKYGERGVRYVHMEIGHAAENVYLQAVSLDLGTVVVGAFNDEEVKRITQMTDEEKPLYIMPVGRK